MFLEKIHEKNIYDVWYERHDKHERQNNIPISRNTSIHTVFYRLNQSTFIINFIIYTWCGLHCISYKFYKNYKWLYLTPRLKVGQHGDMHMIVQQERINVILYLNQILLLETCFYNRDNKNELKTNLISHWYLFIKTMSMTITKDVLKFTCAVM